MLKKMLVLAILILISILLIIFAFNRMDFFSKNPEPATSIKYVDVEKANIRSETIANLARVDIENTLSVLNSLSYSKHEIYSKPDVTVEYFEYGRSDPKVISIFFEDRVAYEGWYLEAWTERMEGEPSRCLLLTESANEFFHDLKIRYRTPNIEK